jgi:hypothetical protein
VDPHLPKAGFPSIDGRHGWTILHSAVTVEPTTAKRPESFDFATRVV